MSALLKTSNNKYSHPILFVQILTLAWYACVLHVAAETSDKNYLKLEQKLKTTTDPIGKAKTLIQMADFQLQGTAHHAKKSNFAEADLSLSRYRSIIHETQEVLLSSGKNAQKNPTGFKDFEIALRRQLRALDDLRSIYPYEQAKNLNETIEEAKAAQESMLVQIFGEGNFGKRKETK